MANIVTGFRIICSIVLTIPAWLCIWIAAIAILAAVQEGYQLFKPV